MDRCCLCGLKANLHRGFCGYCLKDQGIQQALDRESNHWKQGALEAIREAAQLHDLFTADHVKDIANNMGLPAPHHPNCWGGVFHSALSKGIMQQTGKFIASTRAKHHRQRIAEYCTKKEPTEAEKELDLWKRRAGKARKAYLDSKKLLDAFAARGIV